MRSLEITEELNKAIDGAVLASTVLQRALAKAQIVQSQPREADCHGRGNCGNPDAIPGPLPSAPAAQAGLPAVECANHPDDREEEGIVRAMREACAIYDCGANDGVFSCATFAQAMKKLSNKNGLCDGNDVRFVLSGRSDVVKLPGGAHFQMVGRRLQAAEPHGEPSAPSRQPGESPMAGWEHISETEPSATTAATATPTAHGGLGPMDGWTRETFLARAQAERDDQRQDWPADHAIIECRYCRGAMKLMRTPQGKFYLRCGTCPVRGPAANSFAAAVAAWEAEQRPGPQGESAREIVGVDVHGDGMASLAYGKPAQHPGSHHRGCMCDDCKLDGIESASDAAQRPEAAAEVAITAENIEALFGGLLSRHMSRDEVQVAAIADIRANLARAREADRRRIEELEARLREHSLRRERISAALFATVDGMRARSKCTEDVAVDELHNFKRVVADLRGKLGYMEQSWKRESALAAFFQANPAYGMRLDEHAAEAALRILPDLRRQLGEAQDEAKREGEMREQAVEAQITLQSRAEKAERERESLRAALESSALALGTAASQMRKIEDERDEWRKRWDDHNSAIGDLAEVVIRHKGVKTGLTTELAAQIIEERTKERDDLRAKVTELEFEHLRVTGTLTEEKAALQREATAAREAAESAAREAASLRAKVEQRTALLRRCRAWHSAGFGHEVESWATIADALDAELATDAQQPGTCKPAKDCVCCSFCHKANTEVGEVVVAEGAAICNECVAAAMRAIAEKRHSEPKVAPAPSAPRGEGE